MPYLAEAVELHGLVPANRCPATDTLSVLDQRPDLRLVLEDTVDRGGCTYRQVEKTQVFQYPYHLGKYFKAFLKLVKDAGKVREFFAFLKELDVDEACIKEYWLPKAVKGFDQAMSVAKKLCERLSESLDVVEAGSDRPYHDYLLWVIEEVSGRQLSLYFFSEGDREMPFLPLSEEVENDLDPHPFAEVTKVEDEGWEPDYLRMECLHDPETVMTGNFWAARQSGDWKSLAHTIKYCPDVDKTEKLRWVLQNRCSRMGKTQKEVLWDMLHCKELNLMTSKERRVISGLGRIEDLGRLNRLKVRMVQYQNERLTPPFPIRLVFRRAFWRLFKKVEKGLKVPSSLPTVEERANFLLLKRFAESQGISRDQAIESLKQAILA